jgi:GntR family transcriptional regulator, transcriptional repressor for pyruvate dehydrogenase complex
LFFIEIALAAQSERLTRTEVRLQAETGDLFWLPTSRPFAPASVAAVLNTVTDAIADEDPTAARDATEEHVRAAARWLIETRLEMADEEVE